MKKLLLFATLLASLSGWGQTLNPTTITSHSTYTGNTDNAWFIVDLISPASTRKVSGATILQSAVKYSDTANMLAHYVAAINANLAKEKADSLTLAMAINTNSGAISALQSGKVNVSDTASMLSKYLLASIAAATFQPIGAYATTSQLSAYAPLASPQFSGTPKLGPDTLATKAYARSVAGSGNGGYVPSGASTQYIKGDGTYGALDSTNVTGFHTIGFYDGRYGSLTVQNANISAITSLQSSKVNYTDSLIKYVTPTQLQGFNYATTSGVNTSLAAKVNYTDSTVRYVTPTQLGAKADTAGLAKGTFTNLADKDIIFYNLAAQSFNNTQLKTVGGITPFGTGDIPFPTQVNADWNSATGASQILNKPTIPAAQVNSDWNAVSGVAQILNKPPFDSTTIIVLHSKEYYNTLYGSLTQQNTNVTNISALQNRSINTTYPLQGGGNLTADRTFTIDTANWHSYNYYNTKYQAPLSLTTTGTSGAATLTGGVLNIPQYSGGSVSTSTANTWTGVQTFQPTLTGASGTDIGTAIYPTVNATSTEGYDALRIASFEQATGSGTKYLINAGVSSAANGGGTFTSKFKVDNGGSAYVGTLYFAGGTSYFINQNGITANVSLYTFNNVNASGEIILHPANTDVVKLTSNKNVMIQQGGTFTDNGSTLQVSGSTSFAINAYSAAHTLSATDRTCLETTGATGYTVTLPTAVGCKGRIYEIKKVDSGSGAVTVGTTTSQSIIGVSTATTYSLATVGKYVMVQSDNAGWQVIGNN